MTLTTVSTTVLYCDVKYFVQYRINVRFANERPSSPSSSYDGTPSRERGSYADLRPMLSSTVPSQVRLSGVKGTVLHHYVYLV